MHPPNKKIILIGFKNVGKTTIGKSLAEQMKQSFYDLDSELENIFNTQNNCSFTVREIMQERGEKFFRSLEHEVLSNLIKNKNPAVISTGGGAILEEATQKLISDEFIIHITAPKKQVFDRLISNERPAFITQNVSITDELNKLWKIRLPIYKKLAHYSIENTGSINSAITKIIKALEPKKLLLLHGPNLNKLGKRNINHYGELTLTKLESLVEKKAKSYNIETVCYQSNHEGKLIDILQTETGNSLGIIINPGAFTHYSYALYDALIDTDLPIVEVHLSAIDQREPWRNISVTAPACIACISGKKENGYLEAIELLMEYINVKKS